jgi:ribosomal protein L11 methyltransferase
MREVVLRVPRAAVEDILDRLLPIIPGGVREVAAGRHVELKLRGPELPPLEELKRAVGRWPHRISEHEVSDDWRERRAADYEPELIGERLVVRPEWAPAAGSEIELVLEESAAFGAGSHPTTRTCLELLLKLAPRGAFADLGCGSGVLAILAARLGWSPVVAIDVQAASIAATEANAVRNGVSVEARLMDLSAAAPPPAAGFAANVPPALHRVLAARLPQPLPQRGILSGFGPHEADQVADAYRTHGLAEEKRIETHGWTVLAVRSG